MRRSYGAVGVAVKESSRRPKEAAYGGAWA